MSCRTESLVGAPFISTVQHNDLRWYAAYTYPRHEKAIADRLEALAIEAFLPSTTRESRWKDRRVRLQTPVFPRYLFARFQPGERGKVLGVPGVIRMLSFNGMPAPIDDAEMEAIRLCLDRGVAFESYPALGVGDRVRVRSGLLEGLEGVISRSKDERRLLIPITLINQSIAIEVDVESLELLQPPISGAGRPTAMLSTARAN